MTGAERQWAAWWTALSALARTTRGGASRWRVWGPGPGQPPGAAGFTDADLDAELAEYNAERRD